MSVKSSDPFNRNLCVAIGAVDHETLKEACLQCPEATTCPIGRDFIPFDPQQVIMASGGKDAFAYL